MFSALKSWLTNAASSVATKYALRASIAVPFLFAAAFAIAAVTVFAVEAFGTPDGYLVTASRFMGLGVLSAIIVWWREKDEEKLEASPAATAMTRTATQVAAAVRQHLLLTLTRRRLRTGCCGRWQPSPCCTKPASLGRHRCALPTTACKFFFNLL